MPQRTTLAKLSSPRLYAVTRRERLFTLLDTLYGRHHPLIWLSGPAGSGKTSLVASYLAERKQATLWYHVDAGDADLATFFHFLGQAAQAATGKKRLQLPALTPEFMADVPGFTRRFMRQLWANVPLPATLVLDNYQDLSEGAALHMMWPLALTEFPPGAKLVVISREEAPEHWTQMLTQPQIGFVRWDDLRLTFDETQALAVSMPGLTQTTLQSLHAQTNGWVAGTVLMLERLRTEGTWTPSNSSAMHTGLFAYFAQEVFELLAPLVRTVLMRSALLPWVSGSMAEELSGQPGAEQVLHDLFQRGLFVDRRADAQVTYHYHDLFREFLLDHCQRRYSEEELYDLRRTTAAVAERMGQQDSAVALYADTQSWDDLSRLICEIGQALLAQGRYQTLQGYIAFLPQAERQTRPWLLYWAGMSQLVFNPSAARADFEAAYHHFEGMHSDPTGIVLAGSAIIESYYCELADMAATISWGDRLHLLIEQYRDVFSPAVLGTVLARLNGLLLACPQHQLLNDYYHRIDLILTSLENPKSLIEVAAVFNMLALWKGDLETAHLIVRRVRSATQETALPALSNLTWKVSEANYAWNIGDWDIVRLNIQKAYALADAAGMAVFKPMIWSTQTLGSLTEGDDSGAEDSTNLLETVIHNSQRLALGQYNFNRAGIAFIRGDLPSAYQHATHALNTIAPLCLPFLAGNCRIGLAKILIELREFTAAREYLSASLESARTIQSVITEIHCFITMAQLSIKQENVDEAKGFLSEGLRKAREANQLCLEYWWRPQAMVEILAHALESGIEVEYVRHIIRRRGLRAPSPALKNWPYPVKIASLGRFAITIDDTPLSYSGKTQHKPLELLKFLCMAGTQGIHQDLVEETLWPDADGEAADQAFRTTLHRLRKLLRYDDAVRLSGQQVSLDSSLVSLDHIAFQRLGQDMGQTDPVTIEHTLTLYRGHFLHGETASWIFPLREQLRAQFLELTERLGALLEDRGDVHEAAQKYLRALEVEPVAEVMCRRLMTAYVRLQRGNEAIAVYQRFSHALRTKLGVSPAAETVTLYNSIM